MKYYIGLPVVACAAARAFFGFRVCRAERARVRSHDTSVRRLSDLWVMEALRPLAAALEWAHVLRTWHSSRPGGGQHYSLRDAAALHTSHHHVKFFCSDL
jgi:hypothetical protein